MLTIGTEIQILKSGASVAIEEIDAGCPVFNPLTGGHATLIDVLKRQIIPSGLGHVNAQAYSPIRIPENALGHKVPSKDLLISRAQVLLMVRRTAGVAELEERSALSLCAKGIALNESARINLPITYFVPLFDEQTAFLANGVLLLGCSATEVVQQRRVRAVI